MKKIYIRDLDCYKNATEEEKNHKLAGPNRCFDLSKLPNTDIQSQMEKYVINRGKSLKLLSIKTEIYPFNLFSKFVNDQLPALNSIYDVDETEMIRLAKVWLGKNGRKLSEVTKRVTRKKPQIKDAELIRYIKGIYRFFQAEEGVFNYSSDVWFMKGIPLILKVNPTKNVNSISFTHIPQDGLREEVKRIIYIHLTQKKLGTVQAEMTAFNRFANFLAERHPEVASMVDINRDVFEDYLLFINVEDGRRKSYRTELSHLKSILCLGGNLFDDKRLKSLILNSDYQSEPRKLPQAYSENELQRLNKGIQTLDIQIQRVMFLHQILGTGIAEALSLKQGAVNYDSDLNLWTIEIQRVKTGNKYVKSISEEGVRIFKAACSYTTENYGECEYVFVRDSDPNQPMQYSRLYNVLETMIITNNLVDDNGELFRVKTHMFRSTYGCRLAELGATDEVIANLLGQKNTHSVRHYRRLSNKTVANSTREYINEKNEKLIGIINDWRDDDE